LRGQLESSALRRPAAGLDHRTGCRPEGLVDVDVVIAHGQVVDGTGAPVFSGAVGIRGEQIR